MQKVRIGDQGILGGGSMGRRLHWSLKATH